MKQSLEQDELVRVVLVCAMLGQDSALMAPWASQESSTAAMSILTSMAQALKCSLEGTNLILTFWPLYALPFKQDEHCGK